MYTVAKIGRLNRLLLRRLEGARAVDAQGVDAAQAGPALANASSVCDTGRDG